MGSVAGLNSMDETGNQVQAGDGFRAASSQVRRLTASASMSATTAHELSVS